MSLRTCSDLSEATPLEACLGLYLKPESKIKINVQLPKVTGQSISSWHVMEKIKETVRPDIFLYLKTLKITSNVIKLEGELETKAACERALARLRAAGSLDVNGFTEKLVVRAAHSASNGPNRHDWEAFFRDAKGVNEMKPGERPDTIYLQEIPVRWFTDGPKSQTPCEKLLYKAFGTFGKIRRLEIPRKAESTDSTIGKTSSLLNGLFFEVYIQYEEYVEFSIAMDSLRGKKLLYKESDGKVYSADIKVDFDRTNYLSDRNIRKRVVEKKLSSDSEKAKYSISPNANIKTSDFLHKNPEGIESGSHQKVKSKNVIEVIAEQKKTQLEARLLLRELLLKAEVSEKLKEQKEKMSEKPLSSESLKRMSEMDSTVRAKKIKMLEADKRNIEKDIKHLKRKIEKEEKSERARINLYHYHKDKTRSKNRLKENEVKKAKVISKLKKHKKVNSSKKHQNLKKENGTLETSVHDITGSNENNSSKPSQKDISSPVKVLKSSELETKVSKPDIEKVSNYTKSSISIKNIVPSLIFEKDINMETSVKTEEKIKIALEEEKRLKERLIQVYKEHRRNKEKLIEQERLLKEKILKKLRAKGEKVREPSSQKVVKSVVKMNGKR